MSELESLPQKVVSVVPYFFYDLFGRMFPGFFFLCGVFLAWQHDKSVQTIMDQAARAHTAEWLIGGVIIAVGSFMSGFLLSMISRVLWVLGIPISLATLRDHFGGSADAESSIETAFRAHFDFRLDHSTKKKTYLVYCGRLCDLAVASRNSTLDSVSVRVAAEELLSRSLFAASFILLAASAVSGQWYVCLWYVSIAILSFASYQHYQRKAILEKFQMFLVLFHTEGASKDIRNKAADL